MAPINAMYYDFVILIVMNVAIICRPFVVFINTHNYKLLAFAGNALERLHIVLHFHTIVVDVRVVNARALGLYTSVCIDQTGIWKVFQLLSTY